MKLKYIGKNILINEDTGRKYEIDDIGRKFLEVFGMYGTTDKALHTLKEYYKIDYERIKKDYFDFLEKLDGSQVINVGELPINKYVVLEPTNECSGNCIHCFQKNINKFSWSKEKIRYIIEVLKKEKIKSVSLTGGEIFSPHYVENAKYLISELNKNQIKIITVSTNGMFIDSELLSWLDKNIDKSVTTFRISLDAVDENIIKDLRPGYKAKYNRDIIKTLNDKQFNLVITTIIYKQSSQEILNIAQFISNFNFVKKWLLKPIIPTKKQHKGFDLNWEDVKNIYWTILEFYRKNKISYNFVLGNVLSKDLLESPNSLVCFDLESHPCKEEINQRTIKASEKITRCPILSEINEEFQIDLDCISIKNNILLDDLKIKDMKCKECKYRRVCGGGCRAYAIAYNQGNLGCDLNSNRMWNWITQDKYFRRNWPDFVDKVNNILNGES